MGQDTKIFVFWMLSFKPGFSLSSLTFMKRLFSSSSLSAIRVVSSVYLKLLIFLPAILFPACASSSPAFLMMYTAYKLNKQGDNIQPWRTPFPIWNQSVEFSFSCTCLFFLQNLFCLFWSLSSISEASFKYMMSLIIYSWCSGNLKHWLDALNSLVGLVDFELYHRVL